MADALAGLRILLVEDEVLIAMSLEDALAGAGGSIIGPFPGIKEALAAVHTETIDVAVLDVNLAGAPIYPVADELARRRVPYLFVTGYGGDMISKAHADRPSVRKPFRPTDLINGVLTALGKHRAG